jgi:large subunit ribosomal protein L29
MKASELHDMTDGELAQRLNELYQERFNLRFQMASKQLENTGRIKSVRREIAQILTVQRERELKAEVEDAA